MTDPDRFAAGTPVAVLTTQPLGGCLDYLAPEGGCAPGEFVVVPLGPRQVAGVVWGPAEGGVDRARLRPVGGRIEVRPMAGSLRSFLTRAAAYTLTPLPAMLRLATRTPGLGDGAAMQRVYLRGAGEPDRMTAARARLLDALDDHDGQLLTMAELTEAAGVGATVVKGMVRQGVVVETERPRDLPYPPLDPAHPGPTLSADQAAAADRLRAGLATGGYGTTLLQGVTGSGKTEV